MATNTAVSDKSDHQRDLTVKTDGSLRLVFTVKLGVHELVWVPRFLFTLKSVALEATDLLESELLDKKDGIAELRTVVDTQRAEIEVLRAEVVEVRSGKRKR